LIFHDGARLFKINKKLNYYLIEYFKNSVLKEEKLTIEGFNSYKLNEIYQ